MLDNAEYVEQAYLFDLVRERIAVGTPMQELLAQLRHELLATTRLPMAIEYMLTELRHSGLMGDAMSRLGHYFSSFQTFLIRESERETGRFSIHLALQVLQADAKLRADYTARLESIDTAGNLGESFQVVPRGGVLTADGMAQRARSGFFFFQFEVLSRNRLGYDAGLTAMSSDPIYNADWAKWLLNLRANVGLVDLADLLFLASDEYRRRLSAEGLDLEGKGPFLFGEKEGRIALANRRKDPVYLFGAMQRHLGYPPVPRPVHVETDRDTIPAMLRRIERLESRIKLMEQEQRQEFDLSKFYKKPDMD
ncbi:hypothetical protein [Allorhodopirellula heiligendammensis]|uniref:Uncharacterized protein n=1 Tax=Allorhodopirellula heiligendammensis TaxID=2714739 RepID=A0A5C6C2B6_9BACT|nr:hypothetical protein [Allorhodopirellula heiligendammensis]TWU18312.1 hypothetical protein Poly21_04740 [Allorhodopirellula heiligendammensis]